VAGAAGGTRQISASGTGHLVPVAPGSGALEFPEIRGEEEDGDDAGPQGGTGPIVDRSSGQPGHGAPAQSGKKAKSNPELNKSFEGLNFRQQLSPTAATSSPSSRPTRASAPATDSCWKR